MNHIPAFRIRRTAPALRAALFALLFALLCAQPASANDGLVVAWGGGIEPVEQTSISIQREDLDIVYNEEAKNWTVSVTFYLFNPESEAIEHNIAFINQAYTGKDARFNGKITDFTTRINGKETPHAYSVGPATEDGFMAYTPEYFTSRIRFYPGLTEVSHRYTTTGALGWGPLRYGIGYTLTTANKWNGPIGVFNATVRLPPETTLLSEYGEKKSVLEPFGDFNIAVDGKQRTVHIRNGGLCASIRDFRPETDLFVEFYDREWYLSYYDLFGEYPKKAEDMEKRITPWALMTREITAADLARYPKEKLRYIRNAVYALHGYDFKDPELKAFFEKFPWYKRDPDFSESRLSDLEKRNIKIIARAE